MVVATATDVGVLYRRAVRDLLLRVGSVEAVLEDRGDGAVASRADVIAAPTGSFEPVDSIFLGEPQDAEAGAESLLGMRLRADDRFEQRERCRTDLLSLSHEARWRPLGIAPMRARHMFWDRRVPVPHNREGVAGDARAAMENLDRRAGDARLDHLADEPRRRRVIVAGDLDVVVGGDASPLPLGIAIRFGRQWLERWTLDRLQQPAPALSELAHDPVIEIGDTLADRDVELIEREEAPGAVNSRRSSSPSSNSCGRGQVRPTTSARRTSSPAAALPTPSASLISR